MRRRAPAPSGRSTPAVVVAVARHPSRLRSPLRPRPAWASPGAATAFRPIWCIKMAQAGSH
eukprot:8369994-Alexandrium_andersonii.AAC.1